MWLRVINRRSWIGRRRSWSYRSCNNPTRGGLWIVGDISLFRDAFVYGSDRGLGITFEFTFVNGTRFWIHAFRSELRPKKLRLTLFSSTFLRAELQNKSRYDIPCSTLILQLPNATTHHHRRRFTYSPSTFSHFIPDSVSIPICICIYFQGVGLHRLSHIHIHIHIHVNLMFLRPSPKQVQ